MEKSTQRLTELCEQRLDCVQRFLRLAQTQSDLIANGEPADLTAILAKKQTLLETLADLQSRLEIYADDDPETRVWESPERRAHCREVVRQSDHTLRQIKQIEEQSIDRLANSREALSSQLTATATYRHVHSAYAHQSFADADSPGRNGGLDLAAS